MRSTSVFCYGIKPAMKNLTVVSWLLAFIDKREKQAKCTDNRSKFQSPLDTGVYHWDQLICP